MLWRHSPAGFQSQCFVSNIVARLSKASAYINGFLVVKPQVSRVNDIYLYSPVVSETVGSDLQGQFRCFPSFDFPSLPHFSPKQAINVQPSLNQGNSIHFTLNRHFTTRGVSNHSPRVLDNHVFKCWRRFSNDPSTRVITEALNSEKKEVNENVTNADKHAEAECSQNSQEVGAKSATRESKPEEISISPEWKQDSGNTSSLRAGAPTLEDEQLETGEIVSKGSASLPFSDVDKSSSADWTGFNSDNGVFGESSILEDFSAPEDVEKTKSQRFRVQDEEKLNYNMKLVGVDVEKEGLDYGVKEEIRLRSAARRAFGKSEISAKAFEEASKALDRENLNGDVEKKDRTIGGFPLVEASEEEKQEYQRRAAQLAQAILGGFFNRNFRQRDQEEGVDSLDSKEVPEEAQRSLRIGIIGAPNAGKSVLANVLVGSKISAVSRKTNTTRMEILGVSTKGDTQLLLYDTPGVAPENTNHPLKNINKRMMSRAWGVMEHCEVLILLIDAERQIRMTDRRVESLMRKVGSELPVGQRRIACLNKVDLIRDKRILFPLADQLQQFHAFERVFMISGLKGSGVRDLEKYLRGLAVLRPWEEDPSQTTTQSQSQLALEIVRECILDRVHQELPYTLDQVPVSNRRLSDGSLRIEQMLLVANETQRALVVGKGGDAVRQIGIAARKQLEDIFKEKVHLILQVKSARK